MQGFMFTLHINLGVVCVYVQRANGQGFIRVHIPWPILSREAELQKIKVPVKKVSSSTPSFTPWSFICLFQFAYFWLVTESWCMNWSAQIIFLVSMFSLSRSVNCGNGWALLEYGIPLPAKSARRFNQTSLSLTSKVTHRHKSTSKPSNTLLSETSSTCEYLYCHT